MYPPPPHPLSLLCLSILLGDGGGGGRIGYAMTGELLSKYISTYLLVWYPSKICQADDSNSPGTVGTSQVSSHLLVGTVLVRKRY
jgi:hypothetical protein